MIKFLKTSGTWAMSIITLVFTFAPETIFERYRLLQNFSDEVNVALNRVGTFIIIFILSILFNTFYLLCRNSVEIKEKNHCIKIEYGDIFEMHDCRKVIPFDECFTTSVGNLPSDIKPTSICGKYLEKNPQIDMQSLVDSAQLKPSKSRSKYQNKKRYDSGTLVPNGEYLLMSFAKLDKDGLGTFFSRDEFLDSLSTLWKEIDKYYGQKDVCISILGSGTTRMDSGLLNQQELLDIIISSYKLSPHKIKSPYKLHIVCKKNDDFSLNKIGKFI